MKILIENLVLPNDAKMAVSLYDCCYYCLNKARFALYRDELEEAERWVNEFRRCKRDLDALIEKKKWHDKIQTLAEDLNRKGIDVMAIKKLTAPTVSK